MCPLCSTITIRAICALQQQRQWAPRRRRLRQQAMRSPRPALCWATSLLGTVAVTTLPSAAAAGELMATNLQVWFHSHQCCSSAREPLVALPPCACPSSMHTPPFSLCRLTHVSPAPPPPVQADARCPGVVSAAQLQRGADPDGRA